MGRPTVVWLTLESTRADHTSLAGYERSTTPNLERIAAGSDGRSFDEAVAHGIWTLPSSASILTGTTPTHHDAGIDSDAVPPGLPTAAEAFRELGYTTACLSTNFHLSEATGLDRGFDRFGWLSRDTLLETVDPRTLAKFALNLRRHSAGLTTDPARHATGYLVTDTLKRWLRATDEPLFLYAHYGDPHRPYYPPLAWGDRYLEEVDVSEDEARSIAVDHHEHCAELIADGLPLTDREWAALRAMYDAEIAYVDHLVGHLFDVLRSRVDDLVVVVTADHGELFGEGGMLAHKVVVDDAVSRVPLVTYGLDALTDHGGELVQHADVMGTILAELGYEGFGQGVDLRERRRERAIVQRGGPRAERNLAEFLSLNPTFEDGPYHRGTLNALRADGFTYRLGEDRAELVCHADERTDVADEHPRRTRAMHEDLVEFLEGPGRPFEHRQREGRLTDAMRRQLGELGYLE
jgi:uncharacterized sulfatase